MKTVIYTICKNEIKHVERFMEHTKEADYVYIADTGSTDGTQEKLRALGATVFDITITPWRFDLARNTILNLLPRDADWCASIDLDEFFVDGWKAKLDAALKNTPNATRINYMYTWNWKKDGTPATQFVTNKFHQRFDYKWTMPCHEMLSWTNKSKPEVIASSDIHMEHHADDTKSRGYYLDLLLLSVAENPTDPRSAFYLGREYTFKNDFDKAIEALQRYLKLPTCDWDAERCAAMRLIADCFHWKKNENERIKWLLRACGECPHLREPWLALSDAYYSNKEFSGSYFAAKRCLEISYRLYSYVSKEECWGPKPYDLASISAWSIKLYEEAYEHAQKAYEMNKSDNRLKNNLMFMSKSLGKSYNFE